MTVGQIKFLILLVAGFLGLFFRMGLVGWWGLITGILTAIIGPIAVSIYDARANRRRKEQALQVLSMAMMKQAERRNAQNQSTSMDA